MPPKTNPTATGINARLFHVSSAFSKEGKRSDHKEAESIIPEARPIVMMLRVFDGFLKK